MTYLDRCLPFSRFFPLLETRMGDDLSVLLASSYIDQSIGFWIYIFLSVLELKQNTQIKCRKQLISICLYFFLNCVFFQNIFFVWRRMGRSDEDLFDIVFGYLFIGFFVLFWFWFWFGSASSKNV